MTNDLINQDNLNRDDLFKLFQDAYLDVHVSEKGNGDYIQDRFKTWFDVDKKNEFVRFSIMLKVNTDINENAMYNALNEANKKYMMCRAFYNGNVVEIDHYKWINGGVDKKNMIFSYKFFTIASGEMVNYLVDMKVLL